MDTPAHRDVFLWPDGYWCSKEDFPVQPRQTYNYVLLVITDEQWNALRAGAPIHSMFNQQPHDDKSAKH